MNENDERKTNVFSAETWNETAWSVYKHNQRIRQIARAI